MTPPGDATPSAQGYQAASADTEHNAGVGPTIQDCPRRGWRPSLRGVTRWFGRPRAANTPAGPPKPDAYKIHWVWVGGDLAEDAQQNIVAWTNTFHTDVAAVLWVDDAALQRLHAGWLVNETDDGKKLLLVPGMNPEVEVEIKNISTLADAGVPGWGRLAPAVAHETTHENGLRQVASDIVRVAALWHEGGAYWDLGDTGPSARRFSPKKLSNRFLLGGPAVIPQVLGADKKRTENGIIVTNPRKQAEAKQHYAQMLNDMAAQYPTPDARTTKVAALVDQWKADTRRALNERTLAYNASMAAQLETTPGPATRRVAAQRYIVDNLHTVNNPRQADALLTAALRGSGHDDQNVKAIVDATRKQDEGAYFSAMEGALGSGVNPKFLPMHTSLTVNDHTFETFVNRAGSQVGGKDLPEQAANLDKAGWSKVQDCFGGNTKAGSWYSWKTGPGRTLAAEAPAPGAQG